MSKPKVWYLPTPSHTQRVFRPETYQRMLRNFEVRVNPRSERIPTQEIEEGVTGFDALVTGWGTAPLSAKVFRRNRHLKLIAHSAGSVKFMLTEELLEKFIQPRGITVFSANHAIAYNVAEHTVGALIFMSRRIFEHALTIRTTALWRKPDLPHSHQYLLGATVGIVGASKVGREVMRLLKPFDVKILIYDPYLSNYEAGALGVERCSLNQVFRRSDFVTCHAPNIPATNKMIGRRQLRLLRDGGVFINTSRGACVDHDALLAEAQSGRLFVHLDVTTPEPLPPDHPLRPLPNVVITPHISGAGYYGYMKIGDLTLQALEDFFSGKPVGGAVRLENWEIIG